jgi:hypothetical protein
MSDKGNESINVLVWRLAPDRDEHLELTDPGWGGQRWRLRTATLDGRWMLLVWELAEGGQ